MIPNDNHRGTFVRRQKRPANRLDRQAAEADQELARFSPVSRFDSLYIRIDKFSGIVSITQIRLLGCSPSKAMT
jgi:hypothetical protein